MSEDPRSEVAEMRTPFAQDAEESVLGAMLMDRDAVDTALELLKEDSFYMQPHRKLFAAIVELADKGVAVDPISLADRLRKQGQLEEVGGLIYDTAGSVPTAANVEFHAHSCALLWLWTVGKPQY